MFKVQASSLEQYLDFDPARRAELVAFDAIMVAAAPGLTRHLHAGTPGGEPGMRFKMIGYGPFCYPASSGALVDWPVVGLALQKNYISVYLSVAKNGAPLLDGHRATLNALRSGRNNFSFQRLADLDLTVLRSLMAEAADLVAADPNNPVHYRTGLGEA